MTAFDNEDLQAIRHEAQRLLRANADAQTHEALLDMPGDIDRRLWALIVQQGWPGAAFSEEEGGAGLGWPAAAMLAEELGTSVAAQPLLPTLLAARAVFDHGDAAAIDGPGHKLRDGHRTACLALASLRQGSLEGAADLRVDADGRLSGRVGAVSFGAIADDALLCAQRPDGGCSLLLVALDSAGVTREIAPTIDDARGYATLAFDAAKAICLTTDGQAAASLLLDRAATLLAFEQLGGAGECLRLAIEHAQQRQAFGQPVARFQAIKHKLVDVYSAIEIARGCALSALAALAPSGGPAARETRRELCAAARLAAGHAYELAARDAINVFGALGLTREAAPHRHYRRARALALDLGSTAAWRESLVDGYVARRQAPAAAVDTAAGIDDSWRARAARWLAEHAPAFSGAARRGLDVEADLALARRWQALKAASGYAGLTLPIEYGGAGRTELEKLAFSEEELRYDLPLVYYSISLSNPVPIVLRHAQEAHRLRLGPPAIRGEHIWCQMFSEPAAGSDLAALRTRAERDGDGWRLNGQKLWTSWAQIADWGVILVRTDASVPKHQGLSYFFIDMRSAGVTVRPIARLGGEPDLNEVFLDDVFVPDSQRLGAVGEGFKLALETLMIERYGVVDESGYAPSLEALTEIAARSSVAGEPALRSGEFRAALAQGLIERQGLRDIHRRALAAMAAGREPGPEGALRKLLLGRSRQRLAALAMDLQGPESLVLAPGDRPTNSFAQAWLDPSLRIAGGTDEVLMNTLAERVLGLPQDHRPDKGRPFKETA